MSELPSQSLARVCRTLRKKNICVSVAKKTLVHLWQKKLCGKKNICASVAKNTLLNFAPNSVKICGEKEI